MRIARGLAAMAIALAACGADDERNATPPPPDGWIDVPGMVCADGSPTGIGISRGPADAVLVYLAGGNACWSETECTASPGPFGREQFEFVQLAVGNTLFDRTLAGNPFATWTVVLVPYCTGDVHAGALDVTHGSMGLWRHRGYANLQAAVERMVADLPRPGRLVVSGSSAGGLGALVAYDLLRARWDGGGSDPVQAALVDDSGPTLIGSAIPAGLRTAWWNAWDLSSTVDPLCPGCRDDLSQMWSELSARHPGDRLALVSTTGDDTMRGFFDDPSDELPQLSPAEFEAALAALSTRLDELPDAATFRVAGPGHTLFFAPTFYTAGGKTLAAWLGELASGDPAWGSAGP